jgi:hypothetical protein
VTREPPSYHSLHFLCCMAQRLLLAITKVYYRSMSCFAMASQVDTRTTSPLAMLWFPEVDTRYHDPSCTMWAWVKSQANLHPSEQDTQPIVFLISKQASPYQTRGGTCCLGVSTPKIWSLADLSITCMMVLTISTIPTIAQTIASILTWPNHISTDGRPHLSH